MNRPYTANDYAVINNIYQPHLHPLVPFFVYLQTEKSLTKNNKQL